MITAVVDVSGLGSIGTLLDGVGTLLIAFLSLKSLQVAQSLKRDVKTNTAISQSASDHAETAVGELKTLNGKTVGQYADAEEARRSEAIPEGDRTEDEQHMVDTADSGAIADKANPHPTN